MAKSQSAKTPNKQFAKRRAPDEDEYATVAKRSKRSTKVKGKEKRKGRARTRARAQEEVEENEEEAEEEEGEEAEEEEKEKETGSKKKNDKVATQVPVAVLRSTTRTVSKATVDQRWKPLAPATRRHLKGLFEDSVVSVLPQVPGERRRIAAQQHLNVIVRKIDAALEKTTVPTQAAGKDFNYGRLTTQNRLLEMTLLPELEQVAQMEAEIEREERAIREDEEELEGFREKKGALDARNAALHRTKLHPLLKLEVEDPVEVDDATIRAEIIKTQPKRVKDNKLAHLPDRDQPLRAVRKSIAARLQQIDDRTRNLDAVSRGINLTERRVMELFEGVDLMGKVADRVCV